MKSAGRRAENMAPRSMGQLMSIISHSDDPKTICNLYFQHLKEIHSNTKIDITNNLIHLSLVHANELRNYLAQKLLQSPKLVKEMTCNGLVHVTFDKNNRTVMTPPRLCRRFKDNPAHEDIYALGLSIVEDTFEVKGLKGIFSPGQQKQHDPVPTSDAKQISEVPSPAENVKSPVKSVSTNNVNTTSKTKTEPIAVKEPAKEPIVTKKKNAPIKGTAQTKTSASPPLIDNVEASLIASVNAIRGMLEEERAANKQLKDKIELLTTKVDAYGKELIGLKSALSTTGNIRQNTQPQPSHIPQHFNNITQMPYMPPPHTYNTAPNNTPNSHTPATHNNIVYPNLNVQATPFIQPGRGAKQPSVYSPPQQNNQQNNHLLDNRVSSSTDTSSSERDDDGYQVQRRRRSSKQTVPIYGTKTANGTSIAGPRTPRQLNFFIGGISNNTSEEDMARHIQGEIGIAPICISINKINNFNRSFKVTIKAEDKETLTNPELWHENVIIKTYRENRTRPSTTTNPHAGLNQYPSTGFTPAPASFSLPTNHFSNLWSTQYPTNNGLIVL